MVLVDIDGESFKTITFIVCLLALVLFVYIVLLVGIGLPLFMLFVFMGSYCRKGYMKYWQCIPLLKGKALLVFASSAFPFVS